jgi:serine palmitoyltransferase
LQSHFLTLGLHIIISACYQYKLFFIVKAILLTPGLRLSQIKSRVIPSSLFIDIPVFSLIMGALSQLIRTLFLISVLIITASFVPTLQDASPHLTAVRIGVQNGWALVRPGGYLHPSDLLAQRGHFIIEGFLLVVISLLLFQSSYKPKAKPVKGDAAPLTTKEIEELCQEWQPEPLWGELTEFQKSTVEAPVITGEAGVQVVVNGKKALNMVSLNYLGLAGNADIRRAAKATIEKYGVGSCGPRGFYGTIDVHLQLEERLARFMGTQEAILYSYDLATLPSIIPAFASKKDLIICDEGVNYSIRNGCNLSRARVLYFKHNDVASLEAVLQSVTREDARQKRPLNRRFIAVEGIYANYGDLAPLADIIKLKEKYKYRLLVDESNSLGTLGQTGRGAAQQVGARPQLDVEIVGASLGNAIASIGGFCAAEREIVDHQRLSGAGYCFSASLPPYLASAAIAALDVLEKQGPVLMSRLHSNAQLFRRLASTIPGLYVVGSTGNDDDNSNDDDTAPNQCFSPLIHLRLHPDPPREAYDDGDMVLQKIVQYCLSDQGVLFTVSKYSKLEDTSRPPPSIRVAVTASHQEGDVKRAVKALTKGCGAVLPSSYKKKVGG